MSDLIPGMYWNDPHENAPGFVKGRVSFHLQRFIEWAEKQQANEKGYLNAQLLVKKDGSGTYFKLDTYQKQQPAQGRQNVYVPRPNSSSDYADRNGDRAPSGRSQGYADRKSVPYRADDPDDGLIPF
jgi:hypothetical protein